ncbi:MAG: type II secretion system protein [Armatimonadetes bacterium]|nr:type II secretion system protein [Armatimonadota bacterium]
MIRTDMQQTRARIRGERGFSFVELLVALSLLSIVSIFVMLAFVRGIAHAGRSNEQAAATTLAMQIMEQIRASVNPYEMVGFVDLPRSSLPLPDPYTGVTNPTPHVFEVGVDVSADNNLTLITATVQVYRPADAAPFVTLTTVLDDQ